MSYQKNVMMTKGAKFGRPLVFSLEFYSYSDAAVRNDYHFYTGGTIANLHCF